MGVRSAHHFFTVAMRFQRSTFVAHANTTTTVLLRPPSPLLRPPWANSTSVVSSFAKSVHTFTTFPAYTMPHCATATQSPFPVPRSARLTTLASPRPVAAPSDEDTHHPNGTNNSNNRLNVDLCVATAVVDGEATTTSTTTGTTSSTVIPVTETLTFSATDSAIVPDGVPPRNGPADFSNSRGHEDVSMPNAIPTGNIGNAASRSKPLPHPGQHLASDPFLDFTSDLSPNDDVTATDYLGDLEGDLSNLESVVPSSFTPSNRSSPSRALSSSDRLQATRASAQAIKQQDSALSDQAVRSQSSTERQQSGPAMTEFRISKNTLERLARNGITHATEVQAGTFNTVYDGKDIIAKSRTGTGKTLAFALPIMERLAIIRKEKPRIRGQGPGAIVLAPTRELAKQVSREMAYIGEGLDLSVECFYGGSSYNPQESALRRGVDVVVGTPGRIIDHLNRGTLRLDSVSFAVLDEADEMLSMGFSADVETVFQSLPPVGERQVILFSATVPGWVKNLASQYQRADVITFDAVSKGTSLAATTVRHCAVRVPERDEARAGFLADIIAVYSRSKDKTGRSRAIVFCETKREADELATSGCLDGCGAAVLHGDVSQKQREVTLAQFRQGKFQVLVATDVAARGLDISGVDVVVQYRVPRDAEAYIHRSGRTGRAGKSGTAVVMFSDHEQHNIRELERSCNIQFVREAAPSPELALEAAVDVAVANVEAVDSRVVNHLLPRARQMLQDSDQPAELLASILAIAGRRVELPDRSVLSGENGMRTLLVKGSVAVNPGEAIRFISELSRRAGCDDRVGLIRLCRNGAAVVDVPSATAEAILRVMEDVSEVRSDDLSVSHATSIPALKEDERRGSFGGRGGRGRGGGHGGTRRGGGDRYGSNSYGKGGGYGLGWRDRYASRENGGHRSGRDHFETRGGGYSDTRGRRGGRGGDREYVRSYRDNAGRAGGPRRSAEFLSDDI